MIAFARVAAVVLLACAVFGVAGFGGPAKIPVPSGPPALPVAAPAPVPKKAEENRVADARQRVRSRDNLELIVSVLRDREEANGYFPRNITDKNGKPLLSWRVEILPYLDEHQLYNQFKLDEPWDSDHNKKLLAKMPDVYRVGFEPKGATKTYYQGFAGPGTLFDPNQKVTVANITDGTFGTFAVVEAGPPVEWTKPADIPYDPTKPPQSLKGPFSNVLMAATCVGAAGSFRPDLDAKNLHRLIGIADGELADLDDIQIEIPLTAADVKEAENLARATEKLIAALNDQIKEKQKLILEQIKGPKATDDDLTRLIELQAQLKALAVRLRHETEQLKP